MITIEDFQKLEIKIGKIKSAVKAEGADKLLKLIFNLGGEERQIISAIAEYFPDPSVLVGKEIPIITNLEPRAFRGHASQGMIITAEADGIPILLHPEKDIPAGSPVK